MPLPDTEPQNLKYMNYIAITNQLLILHDILHDFNPISHKVRLSKSANLIKQTILSVTDINEDALVGGMPKSSRTRKTSSESAFKSLDAIFEPLLTKKEKREIIQFFAVNLLSSDKLNSIIDLAKSYRRSTQHQGEGNQNFVNDCFVYHEYVKPGSGIMSRTSRAKKRLYNVLSLITDREKKKIKVSIQKIYIRHFTTIYNTYILGLNRRTSKRIASQAKHLQLGIFDIFCIISNIRNNWSIDNYFMNSANANGIEGDFIPGRRFLNIPHSILNKISNILISFTDNYDILVTKILASVMPPGNNPYPIISEEDYAQVVLGSGAMFGGQRGGKGVDELVEKFEKKLEEKEKILIDTRVKIEKEKKERQVAEAGQFKREEERTAAKADSGSDFSIDDWMTRMVDEFRDKKKKILSEAEEEKKATITLITEKIEEELKKDGTQEQQAAKKANLIGLRNRIQRNIKRWRKTVTALSLEEQVNRREDVVEEGEEKAENAKTKGMTEDEKTKELDALLAMTADALEAFPPPLLDDENTGTLEMGNLLERKNIEGINSQQIFPNIKLSDFHERQLIYNRFINAFDLLMNSYSQINDIDDLILLNFAYVMKTSFIVYKNLHENENPYNIFREQEYKNMVFTGFLLITLNAIQDNDYLNKKENPFLITENFIDIITTNSSPNNVAELVEEKAENAKTKGMTEDEKTKELDALLAMTADALEPFPPPLLDDENTGTLEMGNLLEKKYEEKIGGGGMSIIQKGGIRHPEEALSVKQESKFIMTQEEIDEVLSGVNSDVIYVNWFIQSINTLNTFKTKLNRVYNDNTPINFKTVLNNAGTYVKYKHRSINIYGQGLANIYNKNLDFFNEMRTWIFYEGNINIDNIKLDDKILGIPVNEFRIGSSLFNTNAFENLQKFIQPFTAQTDLTVTDNGVKYEIDLELFVKFPIRWIFLNDQQRGSALVGWSYFYDIVSNYDQPHNQTIFQNDPLVISMYGKIDPSSKTYRRISAKRITHRLLYEPMNTLVTQIKGLFTNTSSKSPPSYLGYRIDQRIKNLEKKRKKVISIIKRTEEEEEKKNRKAAREAAQAAKGELTGHTRSFSDYLTRYIAIKGLDKIKLVFAGYFDKYNRGDIAIPYRNNYTNYWATIISRYCIGYDEWHDNFIKLVEVLKLDTSKTDVAKINLLENQYPMGNHNASKQDLDTFIQEYVKIDIKLQVVRKICGLELYCIAHAAGWLDGGTVTHFNEGGASKLRHIVPGSGSLDIRLRTGMQDILTNSYSMPGVSTTPFNASHWVNKYDWNENGANFSLKDVQDNMLIYGLTKDMWEKTPSLPQKFRLTQSPLNTRYIINNAAIPANLTIPYLIKTKGSDLRTEFYPKTPQEINNIYNDTNLNNICTTSSIVDKQPQCTYNIAESKKNRLSLNTSFELLPINNNYNISYIGEVINKHKIGGVDQNGMVVAYNIDLLWRDFNIHINKVINIESGADLKATLVYETVLDAIRDYHTENRLSRALNIPSFWLNKRGDDDFFNRILTNILVKSQGDMIQEINATFRYGAMENMEPWQIDSTKATDKEKDRYNMVTANPSLVSSGLSSDPFRIGISNDQPAGVRKVLYNLYSILGLTHKEDDTRTYMNNNNISGYLGGTNTLMIRGKYKNSPIINIGSRPGEKPQTAFVGGKSKKKTKRKKRKKKKTRRKNKRKKKTKRRRKKKKKTRRRR